MIRLFFVSLCRSLLPPLLLLSSLLSHNRLWINWPRDRYASVPVTLHLELAEISGRIRFGVTRSHSFFSFLGDPLMRISVRNEVGKGAYKFKDFPQLSEYITKKFRAYVHNKIVHPHSHKFRLIWPRNWWPEGTQGEFGGDGDAGEISQVFGTPTSPVPAVPTTPAGVAPVVTSVHAATQTQPPAAGSSAKHPAPAPVSMSVSATPATPAATAGAAAVAPVTPEAAAPSAAEVTERPRASSLDYATDSLSRILGGNQPAPVAPVKTKDAQAGAAAERTRTAHFSASSANSSFSNNSTGNPNSSGSGGGGGGGATSSYQAMRAKVTQWMHNHSSRRNSASDAAADHYHPLSKAVQQAGAQPKAEGQGQAEGQVEGQQDAQGSSRASEHMKGLMDSARHSSLFQPATTADEASFRGGDSCNIDAFVDIVPGDIGHLPEAADKVAREESEVVFDRMALQSLTSTQREVLQDNLAWDLEVKNVINKHMDRCRQLQLVNSGMLSLASSSPSAALSSPIKAHFVYESDWQEDLQLSTYRTAQRCLLAHQVQALRSYSGISGSNLKIPAGEEVPVQPSSPDAKKSPAVPAVPSAAKTLTLSALLEATPLNPEQLTRCRSFELVENALHQHQHQHSDTALESLPDTSSSTGNSSSSRLRSYSMTDFRKEVLDAMFRIHLLEPSVRGSLQQQQSGRPRRDTVHGTGAALESYSSSSGGGSGNTDTSDGQQQQQRPQKRPSFFGDNSKGSGSSSYNNNNRVDIAAKFAEFKAKHLNNRDLAQVFKGRVAFANTAGAGQSAGQSVGQAVGKSAPHSRRSSNDSTVSSAAADDEDDVADDDEAGVSCMRDALIDAEDDPTELQQHQQGQLQQAYQHQQQQQQDGSGATGRGSIGGASGPSSSAAALKYMSTMFRNKFGSSGAGGSADATSSGTGAGAGAGAEKASSKGPS